jgi:DNA-binding transcriptional MerR regulator
MKTGKVAKVFGIDRKTVSNWTENPLFLRFFSTEAQGIDRTQREYLESDILIINTIRVLRNKGRDWNEIAHSLENGERERELPASAMLVETTAPIAQYGRIVELQTALESAEEQIEELQEEIQRLREQANQQDKIYQQRVERLLIDASEREGKLQRELGKLEAMLDIVKKQLEDK